MVSAEHQVAQRIGNLLALIGLRLLRHVGVMADDKICALVNPVTGNGPLGSIAADIFSRLESTSGSNTAGARELELCVLPSTSPAFTQSYEMKRDEWISLCFSRKI